MNRIEMTLHMVPVAKGRPKFAMRGKFMSTYTPKKTKTAENNILAQAIAYKPEVPLSSYAYVAITFFMPIPKGMLKRDLAAAQEERMVHTKKPDLDNLEKTVLDSLNEIFWRDDSIVCSVLKKKVYSSNPRIEVLIQGE